MTVDLDEIGVGWLVSEPWDGGEQMPRSGYVIEVIRGDDDVPQMFTTIDLHRGKLRKLELSPREIDPAVAVRPSEGQAGCLRAVVEGICAEVPKVGGGRLARFTGYQRWLVGVAYQLSLVCP